MVVVVEPTRGTVSGDVVCHSDDVSPPPTEETRPQIKVGDYVAVHSRGMGSSHLPCRVVGEFDGRYQLYCSKGVLSTTFSGAEVIPMADVLPSKWRNGDRPLRSHCAV